MSNIQNCINNTVGGTITGTTNQLLIANDSNTSGSNAVLINRVGGGTADDPFHNFQVTGGSQYSVGIDNSDSDAYVISAGVAPGSTNVMRIASTGEINFPLQSAFAAYLGTTDTNVTGDSTNFRIGSGNALTEIFDQNSDFNTNGTFTAPLTGRYFLAGTIYLNGGVNIGAAQSLLTTSNRTWRTDFPGTTFTDGSVSALADMDAADTATINVVSVDSGGKIDDVFGAATPFTWFTGYLAC